MKRPQSVFARMQYLISVFFLLVLIQLTSVITLADELNQLRHQLIESTNAVAPQNGYFLVNDQAEGHDVDLLEFDRFTESWPEADLPYNRDKQFGGWIKDKSGQSCLNTRGLVLRRDSQRPVEFGSSKCTISGGLWDDPYSGRKYQSAKDIQIDHFVPLKNAYISGAFEWADGKRCLYSNYINNEIHLIPVYGPENQRKSDRTPEGYMPPNTNFKCEYIKRWLAIKLIWNLRLTSSEKGTVERLVRDHNCSVSEFKVSEDFVKSQRQYIDQNPNYCKPKQLTD